MSSAAADESSDLAALPRGILLDIEGTTSSISFVYDVMFPFARRELAGFLASRWTDADVQAACEHIARDAGHDSLAVWAAKTTHVEIQSTVIAEVERLMDQDVKATGLKQLQGLIWQLGFESGELRAHVYDDVPAALSSWHQAGCDLRIYSSGSVTAQELFFAHTTAGDLLPLFRGHYDTTTGPKREPASYHAITLDFRFPAEDILFISDIPAELDAARAAGLETRLCCRPENPPVEDDHGHRRITSFAQLAEPGRR